MNSIKVCEYSRSRSFHDDLILQDQASGERSQDHWSSGFTYNVKRRFSHAAAGKMYNRELQHLSFLLKYFTWYGTKMPILLHNMSHLIRKPTMRFPIRSDTNLYSHRRSI